ncbi:hypothetical protein [Bradyrhizobium genosp. SA-3]|uniref:hypothetical protein n=1 Tax=Bradyrhizobium genosp. SA-3 TaxID=508868 RepID=UPI0013EEB774|nr:hypothetical protein [Bradyrhizobium genosp. SA-3]
MIDTLFEDADQHLRWLAALEAVASSKSLGFPGGAESAGVSHKSEAAAVWLNLRDAQP